MVIGRRAMLGAALAGPVLFHTAPAFAVTLDEARTQGLVGERRDGYLGAVGDAGDALRALIDRVNGERRKAYESVAAQNGVPRAHVEALAGQKLIGDAAPGTFVMDAAGRWIRK